MKKIDRKWKLKIRKNIDNENSKKFFPLRHSKKLIEIHIKRKKYWIRNSRSIQSLKKESYNKISWKSSTRQKNKTKIT